VCYVGVTILEGEGAIFGENMPDKPNTPVNGKLDWSMQRCAHDSCRHLIESVGRVLSAAKGGGIAHSGRSLISTITLLTLTLVDLF